MNLSKKTLIFFFLIIFLAAILRLFHLGNNPPSLYTDEANQGYNAYSLMLTGKDEHGSFLPVSLRSFGDWKPPLPTYLMIPFISLFGLSEISVRLPSAILGIGSVILVFFLVRILFADHKSRTKLGLFASFYLTISPWHILQSRAAMLVIIGLFFLTLAVYLFLKSLEDKKMLIISAVFFALSIYSYYGMRIVTPLIVLFLFLKYRSELFSRIKYFILAAVLGFAVIAPLFISFIKSPDVVFGRARTVSVFYDQGINLRKWELITQDGAGANPLLTRFFHNNLYMYGRSITQRFLSHFDGRFLFMIGDTVPPFQIPGMGILNIADLILIPLGLVIFFKNKYKSRGLIIFWIFVAILPAAFTFITPSSNRTFNVVVPFMILSAIGTLGFINNQQKKLGIFISLLVAISLGYFLKQYFVELPKNHADWWNFGWKETVQYVMEVEHKYNKVIISDVAGMPYIYFLFYEKYPPQLFQKEAIRSYAADRFGFEHVEGFGKYLFFPEFDWNFTKRHNRESNVLYVVGEREAQEDTDYIKAIYYPNGKIAVKLFAYE